MRNYAIFFVIITKTELHSFFPFHWTLIFRRVTCAVNYFAEFRENISRQYSRVYKFTKVLIKTDFISGINVYVRQLIIKMRLF